MFREFDRTIGLKHLVALHLNDSKTARGSRVDRHEHIGKGQIGLEAFRVIMRDRRFRKIPKVLETPKGKELREDVENMKTLRALAGKTARDASTGVTNGAREGMMFRSAKREGQLPENHACARASQRVASTGKTSSLAT